MATFAPSDFSVLHLPIFGLGAYFVYLVGRVIYNLYFHPLAKYPGPKWAAVTNVWLVKYWLGGRWTHKVQELHRQYGEFVRIAPNELSVLSVVAQKDLYGHVTKGKKAFLKTAFYDQPGNPPNLVTVRDPALHQDFRRSLSSAFSSKALRLQTDVVTEYVDQFVDQMGRLGNVPQGIPMEEWFNWLTFDIIGDLAFGEPFGAIQKAETTYWIKTVVGLIDIAQYQDTIVRFPTLAKFAPLFTSKVTEARAMAADHFKGTQDLVRKRLQRDNNRDDFFSHFLKAKHATIATEFLDANAVIIITAGSETTATTLSALLYYMLKHPQVRERIERDVRAGFKTSAEIDSDSTSAMPYLVGTIEEALRIWSAVPNGLPRVSPGAEVAGEFIPKGTIIHTPTFAIMRSERYWHRAEEFLPQRWLPKDDPDYDPAFANDNHDTFKPFSQGARACLGLNLAYMELRIVLAKLVWHFDFELVDKNLDWERDSTSAVVWKKPQLNVRAIRRA